MTVDLDLTGVAIHYDFDEALERGYDAVVICNPTALHTEFATRAAAASCHLYVEKPVSNTLANTDELVRTVQRNGLVAAVGCQFRFHPNLTAIKGWLDEDVIGRALSVHVDTGEYLPGWHSWEDYRKGYAAREDLGGGVVLTLIHEIDYLYWLLGGLKPVNAFGGTSGALDLAVEDHLTAMLVSEADAPVTLHIDYLQRPPCRRMKIVGSRQRGCGREAEGGVRGARRLGEKRPVPRNHVRFSGRCPGRPDPACAAARRDRDAAHRAGAEGPDT